jgi:fucose permease
MESSGLARPLSLTAFGSFFLIGMVMGVTGPLIPALRADLNLGYGVAGLLFSAQSVGGLMVLLAGGWLVHRFGKKRLLFVGTVAFTAGLEVTAFAPDFTLVLAGNLLLGAGMSFLDIAISTLVIDANPKGKGTALGRLHFFFGAGAVVGPLLALVLLGVPQGWRWALGLAGLGPLAVAFVVPFLKVPPSPLATVAQKLAVYRQPYLWWGALALFVYCGVEWCVGAWFPSYWKLLPGAQGLDPAWATSAFWLTFSVGRILQGPWADRWGFERFLSLSMALTLVVVCLWLAFPQPAAALVWVLLFGFLIAGQYPTFVAMISHRFPQASGQVTSFLSIFASLGTFAWPPSVGAWADSQGIGILPLAQVGMTALMVVVTLMTFWVGREKHARTLE